MELQQGLQCEAASSDRVLKAAIAAMPNDPSSWYADTKIWDHAGPKNRDLLPLLDALIGAVQTVAAAIADNAFEDHAPVDKAQAERLGFDLVSIADDVVGASMASSRESELVAS